MRMFNDGAFVEVEAVRTISEPGVYIVKKQGRVLLAKYDPALECLIIIKERRGNGT